MIKSRGISLMGGILCTLSMLVSFAQPARAGLVGTDEILKNADEQREMLVQALQRDEVAAELEKMGVSVEDARARVNRMTDAEIARLHERVATLPAGGDLSMVEVLLILILVVLIA